MTGNVFIKISENGFLLAVTDMLGAEILGETCAIEDVAMFDLKKSFLIFVKMMFFYKLAHCIRKQLPGIFPFFYHLADVS